MKGKTVLVTGSNTGIGKVTAQQLALNGAHVVLACRNQQKAEAAIADIQTAVPGASLSFVTLDLGSLEAVKAAAEVVKQGPKLDVLVNNAGLAGAKGITSDGFEVHFGVNHIGPMAFTLAIEDHIQDDGRIVNVASRAHTRVKGIDFEAARTETQTRFGFHEYSVSKLCNVLFAAKLAERLKPRGIDVYSLHPGVVASDIWRRLPRFLRPLMKLFMVTNEEGARTSLHCAMSSEAAGKTGLYWDKCAPKEAAAPGRDKALGEALWNRSVEWIG
jgi:retinol dehydrogenase-12